MDFGQLSSLIGGGKIRYIHPGGEYYKGEGAKHGTEAQRDYDELKAMIEKLIAEPSQSKVKSSD